jgi:Tfp pilus assembly protein PilF
MQPLLILVLMLILAGCQPAVRSPYDMQQKFFSGVKNSSVSADQALRSAHYFKIAGRRDLALRELSAAAALEPYNIRLLNALGACYDELGDYTTAQQIFQKSLSLDPDNAAALNNLGYSHYLAGNLEQAETALQASLAKDPNNKRARNNLGMVLCRLGKNDRALSLWQKQDGEAQARDKLAKVMASLGKPLPADATSKAAPTAIVVAQSALPPHKTGGRPERRVQTPDLAESSQPQSKPALVRAAKNSAPPPKAMPGGAPANIIMQPAALTEKVSPEVIPESVSPTPVASTQEKPSSHSRAKIITVVAEKDQRLSVREGEQTIAGRIENCQLLTQPQEQAQPAPPRAIVASAIPDLNQADVCQLEIRNGVGVKHLAKNMRRLLQHHGYNVSMTGNHIDFGAPETVVYFRSAQEKTARALNDTILKAKRLVRQDNLRPEIDVKIVLGHDLFQNNENLAPFQAGRPKLKIGPQLALNLYQP